MCVLLVPLEGAALIAELIILIVIDYVLLKTTYLSIFFVLPVAVSGTVSHLSFIYWKSFSNLYILLLL